MTVLARKFTQCQWIYSPAAVCKIACDWRADSPHVKLPVNLILRFPRISI